MNKCSTRPRLVGPFAFAKGPFYLLGKRLAMDVVSDPQVVREAEAVFASDRAGALSASDSWPWEDVFLGFAVAVAAAWNGTMVHLKAGAEFQDVSDDSDDDLFVMRSTLLVMHDKQRRQGSTSTKKVSRIHAAHQWADRHHCGRVPTALACGANYYHGCRGQLWKQCVVHAAINSSCSSRCVPRGSDCASPVSVPAF